MTDKKPDKKPKKNPNHYVDNKEFWAALCEWKKTVVEAEEMGDPRPPVTDYIGSCFLKIAEGLSKRSCFINYPYREEMIGDAIENAILYAHNFKPEGKNPFAYFTQMMYYAFLRRIQKEKKQMFIKYKLIEQHKDSANFPKWSDENPHEKFSAKSTVNISENDINKFEPKKKVKKSSGGTLDSLI